MGTWSITPNELASIDENGVVNFGEHSEDILYTITYTDDNGKTSSVKYEVKKCGEIPSACTITANISGLKDGDTATINWGDGIIEENKANGEHKHDLYADKTTVAVSARGYEFDPKSSEIDCDGEVEFTATTSDTCTCDNINSKVGDLHLYYDNYGRFVELGSFFTNGCGSVSAKSESEGMFDEGDVQLSSYDENNKKYDEYTEDAWKYVVGGLLTENNTGQLRSCGISIYVKC